MKENTKRIMTVSGAVLTALAIALSLLALLSVPARAATGSAVPGLTDVIPGDTPTLTLPDTDDVLTPDDTTGTPATRLPDATSRPSATTSPALTTAPGGTDTAPIADDGGSIVGAVIAVVVVAAVILAVIALMPRKKR